MKKYLLPLLAALSLGCGTLSAQTITPLEDGKYDIKAGDVTICPTGTGHGIANRGEETLELVAVIVYE